ncbi:MAG: BREX-1 system phosphatase PglZ type A [Chloroflexi bacterium]|nr:MAG: BREX-1 system phosphatase PglZ type A [Chloroflexota bacterium]
MVDVSKALAHLFKEHRIVFWYDAKRELRGEYDALTIPDVVKVEINNNEFGLKYRVLREESHRKFLLYQEGPEPPELENWLLDVQLAHTVFSDDQIVLWLRELGLNQQYGRLVEEHQEFFRSAARRKALKGRLDANDSHNAVRLKMLAVSVNSGTDSRLEGILETLLLELADEMDEKIKLVERFNLRDFLWQRAEIHFGYSSETPGLRDFVIELFKACYAMSLEEDSSLNQDALVFLQRWKDSIQYHKAFEYLSDDSAEILGIEKDLQERDLQSLVDIDHFQLVDQRILSELVKQVVDRTITVGEVESLVWRRRTTHWFEDHQDVYEAVVYASRFIAQLENADLRMQTLADGINKYQQTWYSLDQYYRKFIYHVRKARQATLLSALTDMIENLYSNNYLLPLNDRWQQLVDEIDVWDLSPIQNQEVFFQTTVDEFLKNSNKVAVVISDALRFELGQELASLIESEDRYTAQIEPVFSSLPSYTQLGMAALLPHDKLTIRTDGTVLVDGQSSAGTANRMKILRNRIGEGAFAMRAEELLNMTRDESRTLFRDNSVVYVYHDQIDKAGENEEARVFSATQNALDEIIDILKKLTTANFTNIVITTDHGFIYQHRSIDESEFAAIDVEGEEIFVQKRRYVIGRGLKRGNSLKVFNAQDLGLEGDYEVAIPKSINRLRLKGAGSRYVHGGASLQELVLPMIRVNKKRVSDVDQVEVDIITSSSSIITAGQISVAFYQTEPVTAKLQARKLRAGIYTKEGELISNPEELDFNFTSENARDREVRVRFVLSRNADEANNQTVYLKLEGNIPGTSHYKEYRSHPYELRRSFTTDFDF